MDTNTKMTPKDFFIQLGAIVSLYVSAVSFIVLVFQMINTAFPDSLDYYVDPYSAGIRVAIASLIIVFPLFLFLTRLLNNEVRAHPAKKDLGIRKWLTYITLFVAGIAMAIDLIVVINAFLGGEVSSRFFLKILTVFIVAGLIFFYYIKDLRNEAVGGVQKTFFWTTIALVILAVVGGFVVMGSPQSQRALRFDNQKVSDLQNIQYKLVDYWQNNGTLPDSIESLSDPLLGGPIPKDPETGESYGYTKVGDLNFQLCATFNLASDSMSIARYDYYGNINSESWQHDSGNFCFDRTVNPQNLPPVKRL